MLFLEGTSINYNHHYSIWNDNINSVSVNKYFRSKYFWNTFLVFEVIWYKYRKSRLLNYELIFCVIDLQFEVKFYYSKIVKKKNNSNAYLLCIYFWEICYNKMIYFKR